MSSYCQIAPGHPYHGPYHDQEYGFPISDDDLLFERLVLEINQAGLSWLTILKKKVAFQKAFNGFDIDKVARYGTRQIDRLLNDSGIIRNRLKIESVIENARRIQAIQKERGSFHQWLADHHPLEKPDWVKLFKKTFRFTGGEITGEFLMSTGFLPGAHAEDCPIYRKILKTSPPWKTS